MVQLLRPGYLLQSSQTNISVSNPTQAETTALLARMTVQPDATRTNLYNDLIFSLKNAGVWAKLDALYVMSAHDVQAAGLNLISTSFNLTPVNAPLFTVDQGYTASNTGNKYLNTSYNGVGNFQLNSAYMGIWVRSVGAIGSLIDMGGTGGNSVVASNYGSTGSVSVFTYLNTDLTSSAIATAQPTPQLGWFAALRTSSTNCGGYINTIFTPDTHTSTSISTALTIGTYNTTGSNTSNNQYPFAAFGQALSTTENTALYNALNTFKTSIGA